VLKIKYKTLVMIIIMTLNTSGKLKIEKLRHDVNLPKAHFRWDFGNRYTLTDSDLKQFKSL
jgi:hypothetical protein